MTTFHKTSILVLVALFSSALLAVAGARGGGGRGGGGGNAASAANFLARPDSAEKAPDANGFLQRWLVLDPIPAQGVTQGPVQAAVKKEYFPNQFTVVPKDGDKVTVDGSELTWHALDTKFYNFSTYHFGFLVNKPTTANVLMWAVTVVISPEEMHDVRLAIGSNDASVWWVNGQEVIGLYGDRQTVVDDAVSKRLTLKKGPNIIRCAIHNQQGMTDFCARLLDAQDKPITGITINLAGAGQ
jgi:hypothetical protein